MEAEYLDRDLCAQGVAKKRIRINVNKAAKNICLPAFLYIDDQMLRGIQI
jgi:hypothetical protein